MTANDLPRALAGITPSAHKPITGIYTPPWPKLVSGSPSSSSLMTAIWVMVPATVVATTIFPSGWIAMAPALRCRDR